jgi:signal transduction histidine kinase/TPR repeat protein
MKKVTAILLFVFSMLLNIRAQQANRKGDSTEVKALIDLAAKYEKNDPDSAIRYYMRAVKLSQKNGYTSGRIRSVAGIAYAYAKKGLNDSSLIYYNRADSLCVLLKQDIPFLDMYSFYSWVLNNQSRFDESLKLCKRALDISLKLKDKKEIATAYIAIGLVHVNKSFYKQALENYFLAMDNLQSVNETSIICRLYDRISGCYYPLKLYNKSLEYEEKAISCLLPGGDTARIRNAYFNAGLLLKELGQYQKALSYYQKAIQMNTGTDGDKILDCRLQFSMAALLNAQGDHLGAATYAGKGINFSKALNFESGVAMNLGELGRAYLYLRKFDEAKTVLKEAIVISQRNNLGEELQLALDLVRFAEAATGDFTTSAAYDKMYRKLVDSVFNQQTANNIQELESKYRTVEKQNEITRLQSEQKIQELSLQRKNILNGILIGGVIIILVISLLSYRNYKQKQKMQQQRINELEAEKQLAATEAVLKGEEQERTRLAKDLHDGLGGMLSGIKYSLNTMKGNLIMTPENNQAFERSMDMLDSSIKEMRRVAHNMMPEALVKFGLDTALKDFCNDVNQSGALKISYQSIGLENEVIEQTTAITIYRIVQELINNTMKHAAAKSAIVQVAKTNNQLAITVEDDGKGFDTSILNRSKGIGWSNIVNRVEFLKGKLDINSEAGKGTSVLVELVV